MAPRPRPGHTILGPGGGWRRAGDGGAWVDLAGVPMPRKPKPLKATQSLPSHAERSETIQTHPKPPHAIPSHPKANGQATAVDSG